MTLYIDFDHTLLDTEALKQAFVKALRPLGISEKRFWQAYRRLRAQRTFSIPAFVHTITTHVTQRRRVMRALEHITRNAVRFLYPDALPFVRRLRKRGVRLVLFTHGDPHFQQMKIASIPRSRALFTHIVITRRKAKNIRLFHDHERAGMIDNRSDVVMHYAQRYGMMPFLIVRGKEKIAKKYRAIAHRSLRTIVKKIFSQQ